VRSQTMYIAFTCMSLYIELGSKVINSHNCLYKTRSNTNNK